jgi:hypothetical protein
MPSENIYISKEHASQLIGFEVKVFISELSSFKTVRMSPAEAMKYLATNWADVQAVFMSDEGEIYSSFASVLKTYDGKPAIAVGTYSRTPICCVEGYPGHEIADANSGEWYIAISQQCYALGSDGMIDNSKPGFCYFEGRQNQLLNLAGFDTIRRSVREIAGKAKENRYS